MKNKSPSSSLPVTRIISQADQSGVLRLQKGQLEVIEGPDKGKTKDLSPTALIVGTSAECDLILTDGAVSRKHFELVPEENGFLLRDLGSKNGTFSGTLRLRQATLVGSEEIRLGLTRIRLNLQDSHVDFPLSGKTAFGNLMGRSVAMRQVFAVLERAAGSDAVVLLEGESGTGKDLAAEAIHATSARAEKPFVVVDCGAMSPNLVGSELFGHHKGAFTGADQDRPGAFESGNGGTVFLDEIGELDRPLQQQLLHVLEKREVKRLGENQYRPVDIRLVAATNRDLSADVQDGRFREDLFFRLGVVRLRMPPLRDRQEDIAMMARNFVQKLRPELDPLEIISESVLAMFMNHNWPGNVRELRNVVERLLLFPENPLAAIPQTQVKPQDSTQSIMSLPFHEARDRWNEQFEKVYLTTVLDGCGGVVVRAAERAGIPRQTFHRLLTKHRLRT